MASDSRARLISYLCQAGLSTARANAVLDDYAHGLADKIRDHARTVAKPGTPGYAGLVTAADLITPGAAK
jgi:hypothetical protein